MSTYVVFVFSKNTLEVKKQTPETVALGELCRFPLPLVSLEGSLKYWFEFKSNHMSLVHGIFNG